MRLTERQAFDAMLMYVQKCRAWHLDIDQMYLCASYGELSSDGEPITGDPAHWHDWLECVDRAMHEGFKLEPGHGFWRAPDPPAP